MRGRCSEAEEEWTVRPVQRFHWDSAEYAEAFATLVRCAGERVYERQILREIYAAYPAASHAIDRSNRIKVQRPPQKLSRCRRIKEIRENYRKNEHFCYHFSSMKYTDISTTFSIVKPLFERFSSNLFIVISGYGGLRTFMQTDPSIGVPEAGTSPV